MCVISSISGRECVSVWEECVLGVCVVSVCLHPSIVVSKKRINHRGNPV